MKRQRVNCEVCGEEADLVRSHGLMLCEPCRRDIIIDRGPDLEWQARAEEGEER